MFRISSLYVFTWLWIVSGATGNETNDSYIEAEHKRQLQWKLLFSSKALLTWTNFDQSIVLDKYCVTRQVAMNNGCFTPMEITVVEIKHSLKRQEKEMEFEFSVWVWWVLNKFESTFFGVLNTKICELSTSRLTKFAVTIFSTPEMK